MKLSGKNILITGAAKRIGRAIALELAAHGANILIHYNSSAKDARSLKSEIEARGAKAYLCPLNLAGITLLKIRSFVKRLPVKVDVLVNSASAFYPVPVGKINDQNWEDFMSVNLKAAVLLCQEIGLQMKKRGIGRIVNMGDLMGECPQHNFLPHSISKAGLMLATKGFAKELAPEVLVNAISPGPILEPPFGMSSAARKKTADATLLKRFGKPEDIAHTVRYLIETEYVTGQIIRVDGGKSIA